MLRILHFGGLSNYSSAVMDPAKPKMDKSPDTLYAKAGSDKTAENAATGHGDAQVAEERDGLYCIINNSFAQRLEAQG